MNIYDDFSNTSNTVSSNMVGTEIDRSNATANPTILDSEDDTVPQIITTIYCLGLPLIGFIAAAGNALVLYAAYGSRNFGRLHIFDGVIKSLAWTDLLLGLIGIPCQVMGVYIQGVIII